MKKISIVTATYNSEQVIQACMDSVAEQTAVADIEHIVVDGRSSDATLAIVARYPHVSKVISEKDRGIYHAFNRGVEAATGELIYFLNSDDSFYDSNVVADVVAAFHSEIDFYCGSIHCFDAVTGEAFYTLTQLDDPDNFRPHHQAFVCRRALFKKFGLFNECLHIAADTYFMKKAMLSAKGICTERAIANFSLRGESSDSTNRETVLTQFAIVDNLLGLDTAHYQLPQKLASQNQTLQDIKRLMLGMLTDEQSLNKFQGCRIAIFGARELSQIVYHYLIKQGLDVQCFIVSSDKNLPVYQDVKVIALRNSPQLQLDIIINCVEGSHEDSLSDKIRHVNAGVEVISWRELVKPERGSAN